MLYNYFHWVLFHDNDRINGWDDFTTRILSRAEFCSGEYIKLIGLISKVISVVWVRGWSPSFPFQIASLPWLVDFSSLHFLLYQAHCSQDLHQYQEVAIAVALPQNWRKSYRGSIVLAVLLLVVWVVLVLRCFVVASQDLDWEKIVMKEEHRCWHQDSRHPVVQVLKLKLKLIRGEYKILSLTRSVNN